MTTKPLKKGATYDDLRDVPDHFVAEMFDGDLYTSPRPAVPDAHAASALGAKLGGPFHRTDPGGWVILDEPELHFGNDVLVPDLAGWRRTRMPRAPADAYLTLAHTLEVVCLEAGRWSQLGRYEGQARIRAAPFDAIELELGALWI